MMMSKDFKVLEVLMVDVMQDEILSDLNADQGLVLEYCKGVEVGNIEEKYGINKVAYTCIYIGIQSGSLIHVRCSLLPFDGFTFILEKQSLLFNQNLIKCPLHCQSVCSCMI